MKAYISHSFDKSSYYILTILSRKLSEKGFVVTNSYSIMPDNISFNYNHIINSHLFIGVVISTGNDNNRVLNEWNEANQNKIPSLLLVEDNIAINENLKNNPNVIIFNRINPQPAINNILKQEYESKQEITSQKEVNYNNIAWIIGGGIALLSLIALLSSEEKNKIIHPKTKRKNSNKRKVTAV